MITIGVLVYDMAVDYNITVVDGINDFFNDKPDVQVIVAPVNIPNPTTAIYDYQYWTAINLLTSKQVDAIIVVTNSFGSTISSEDLAEQLKVFLPKPIISVSQPLNIPDNKYTYVSCQKAYDDIVEHMVTKHNRSKFAYITASLTHSPESLERVEAFKKALKNQNIEVNEDWILHGDFTPTGAKKALSAKYKTKEEIPFDTIFCANDYTALGVVMFCNDYGIAVPGEMSVVGFDDSEAALNCYPTLTTINQHITETGYQAAQIAYEQVTKGKSPHRIEIDSIPIYRQSCGCIDRSTHKADFIDSKGEYHIEDIQKGLDNLVQSKNDLMVVYQLLHTMDVNTDLTQFFSVFNKNMALAHIPGIVVCFFDKPVIHEIGEDFKVPDSARLCLLADNDAGVMENYYATGGSPFNPKEEIIPSEYNRLGKAVLFQIPIFLKNVNYGYVLCRMPNNLYLRYSIYIKLLINSIIQAYELTQGKQQREKLVESNQNLSFVSKTDELTQIYNRRGVMEEGQKLIDRNVNLKKKGYVFFCDLDGLKTINDTFGHKTGDAAIRTEAQVLKAVFSENDVVGRLSGDEFTVIAPDFTEEKMEDFRVRLRQFNEEFSKKNQLPFILSISVGAVEYSKEKSNLEQLLAEADRNLYKEKKIKHSKIRKFFRQFK